MNVKSFLDKIGITYLINKFNDLFVHKSSDEIIDGTKTFIGKFENDAENAGIIIRNMDISRGEVPSVAKYWTIALCDSDHDEYNANGSHGRIGIIESAITNKGNTYTLIRAYKNETDTNTNATLQILYPSTGDPYATCPTITDTADNGTGIATTAWVTTADCVVHKTGDETITGGKVFKSLVSSNRSGVAGITLRHPSLVRGTTPSSTQWVCIPFCDASTVEYAANGAHGRFCILESCIKTNNDVFAQLSVYKNVANDSSTACIGVYHPSSGNAYVYPSASNATLLGTSSLKWKEIWCGQSSLNSSSDERLKDEIQDFSDTVLDAWSEVNFQQFKFKDAIEEKGSASARIHSGLIAQRIDSIFKKYNLDARNYGLFLYDEWEATDEEKDDEGNVIHEATPAGNSYGLRYTECLCIEAAYQRRRADRLEQKVKSLEERLSLLEEKLK